MLVEFPETSKNERNGNFSNNSPGCHFMLHMIYVIEGEGALVNEAGEETPLR
jgi:hypothetical protein